MRYYISDLHFYHQNLLEKMDKRGFQSVEEMHDPCNMINCFCMFSDYIPLTLDEWIDVDRKRREAMTFPGQEKSVNE